MITSEELARLAKGATPGPFAFGKTREGERMILGGPHGRYVANITIHQTPRKMGMLDEPEREANAALILALVNALPEIVASMRVAANAQVLADCSSPEEAADVEEMERRETACSVAWQDLNLSLSSLRALRGGAS